MAFNAGFGIIRYNSKILCTKYLLAGLIYSVLLPIIYSFELLQPKEVAMISEIPFSLLGVLFLTAIVEVDFEDGVGEILSSKQQNKGTILLYRLGISVVILGLLTGLLLLYMAGRGSTFDFGRFLVSASVNQIFLGVLGLTFANLSRNVIVGYLVSMSYFFMEFATKGKYTGELYLFSVNPNHLTSKLWIFGIVVILVGMNYLDLRWRRNLH